jgi:hypothetical protein
MSNGNRDFLRMEFFRLAGWTTGKPQEGVPHPLWFPKGLPAAAGASWI